jgi:hypothetical protein
MPIGLEEGSRFAEFCKIGGCSDAAGSHRTRGRFFHRAEEFGRLEARHPHRLKARVPIACASRSAAFQAAQVEKSPLPIARETRGTEISRFFREKRSKRSIIAVTIFEILGDQSAHTVA